MIKELKVVWKITKYLLVGDLAGKHLDCGGTICMTIFLESRFL